MVEIILLSGGIDSVTLLHLKQREGAHLHALFADYGQRAAAEEWRAAHYHANVLAVPLTRLDLAQVGETFRSGQTQRLHVPLPHRNLVALALGLSYAAQIGAQRIHLALNRDDVSAYPSASQQFLDSFNAMARSLGDFLIETPLLALDKTQVILQALALGIDLNQTYSCLLGYPKACGHCPQCVHRDAALLAAGLP
jgi:7-cyano-7-deazaguanine synthase